MHYSSLKFILNYNNEKKIRIRSLNLQKNIDILNQSLFKIFLTYTKLTHFVLYY